MKININQAATTLFRISVQYKASVVLLFKIFYLLITGLSILAWGSYSDTRRFEQFEHLGKIAGDGAVVMFVISLIPGIFRRIGIRHPLLQLIMLFRRHVGIATFFLAFYHGFVYRILSIFINGGLKGDVLMSFEVYGLLALYFVLLPLAVTSNDWAVKTMGKWWKRLHALSYGGLWLIFFHLVVVEISVWSLLIGGALIGEIGSYVFLYYQAREASERRIKTQ